MATQKFKRGAPLPGGWGQRGRPSIYGLESMKDGDHFDTEIREGESEKQAVLRMRRSTTSFRRKHHASLAFTVRAVTHEKTGKRLIRVWARASEPPRSRTAVDAFFR
jgi:hypothetical protein